METDYQGKKNGCVALEKYGLVTTGTQKLFFFHTATQSRSVLSGVRARSPCTLISPEIYASDRFERVPRNNRMRAWCRTLTSVARFPSPRLAEKPTYLNAF